MDSDFVDHRDHRLAVVDTEESTYRVFETRDGADGFYEVIYGGSRDDIETTDQRMFCVTCGGVPINLENVNLSYT